MNFFFYADKNVFTENQRKIFFAFFIQVFSSLKMPSTTSDSSRNLPKIKPIRPEKLHSLFIEVKKFDSKTKFKFCSKKKEISFDSLSSH